VVDLHGQVARRLPFRQRVSPTVQRLACFGRHRAPGFGHHCRRRVGRQWRNHFIQRLQLGPAFGVGGGRQAARAQHLVGGLDAGGLHPA